MCALGIVATNEPLTSLVPPPQPIRHEVAHDDRLCLAPLSIESIHANSRKKIPTTRLKC
jgi:hypothetical protein